MRMKFLFYEFKKHLFLLVYFTDVLISSCFAFNYPLVYRGHDLTEATLQFGEAIKIAR